MEASPSQRIPVREHLGIALAQRMAEASEGFLTLGFNRFLDMRDMADSPVSQEAHGNFCIAVELMLKAYLCKVDPFLVFKELTPEQAVKLASKVDAQDAVIERMVHDFLGDKVKTIEFERAIELFVRFQGNDGLSSRLRIMRRTRNASLHFFLPRFHGFEVERAAFTALSVKQIVEQEPQLFPLSFGPDDREKKFMDSYRQEILDRVSAKLQAAQTRAATLSGRKGISKIDDSAFIMTCLVCGNEGAANGRRDMQEGHDLFWIEDFACPECGLQLEGDDELRAAGMSTLEVW
ncbi:MAG TPA: hypothetical protein VM241_00575 [Candidatus Thermoplasmatota archaeon]|nr:hypothetical protein [Candidatus Thermoplasmatota archaeon]